MNKAEQFVRLMFEDGQQAHKAHFVTTVYARHSATQTFYESVRDLADKFMECYVGRYGPMTNLDMSAEDGDKEAEGISKRLRSSLDWIETNRKLITTNVALQALIDEICLLYMQTLYRLELM